MTPKPLGEIRVGIGGWTFAPWRGVFYPKDLPQKRELEYASSKLTSIEINGTFYGTQKPESFKKWRDETPEDFVFTLKGPRYATNRRILAEAGESIQRFLGSGVLELGDKLGPINWQFAATKTFDREDFDRFLALLPKRIGARQLRHAVEVRHDSFKTKEFIDLAREHDVAIVVAGQSEFPLIADVTSSFVYVRIMGASEKHKAGYRPADLDAWSARARAWASGDAPGDLPTLAPKLRKGARRGVLLFMISGFKPRNPAAAAALLQRLGTAPAPKPRPRHAPAARKTSARK
jgi:uncharacterized protein YecE (DUF72 family)